MRRRCLSKEVGAQMADPLEMQSTPRPLLLLSLRSAGFFPGFCKFLFSIARADFLCEFEWCRRDLPSSPALRCETRETSGSSTRHTPDRKSTRLNSSHSQISYAVFCLKKKKIRSALLLLLQLVSGLKRLSLLIFYIISCSVFHVSY